MSIRVSFEFYKTRSHRFWVVNLYADQKKNLMQACLFLLGQSHLTIIYKKLTTFVDSMLDVC